MSECEVQGPPEVRTGYVTSDNWSACKDPFAVIEFPLDEEARAVLRTDEYGTGSLHLRQWDGRLKPKMAVHATVTTDWDFDESLVMGSAGPVVCAPADLVSKMQSGGCWDVVSVLQTYCAAVTVLVCRRMVEAGMVADPGSVVNVLSHIIHKMVNSGNPRVSLSVRECELVTGLSRDKASEFRMVLFGVMSKVSPRHQFVRGAFNGKKATATERRAFMSEKAFSWLLDAGVLVPNLCEEFGVTDLESLPTYPDVNLCVRHGVFATKNAVWFSGKAVKKSDGVVGFDTTDRIGALVSLTCENGAARYRSFLMDCGLSRATTFRRSKKAGEFLDEWSSGSYTRRGSRLHRVMSAGKVYYRDRADRIFREQNEYRGYRETGDHTWMYCPEWSDRELGQLEFLGRKGWFFVRKAERKAEFLNRADNKASQEWAMSRYTETAAYITAGFGYYYHDRPDNEWATSRIRRGSLKGSGLLFKSMNTHRNCEVRSANQLALAIRDVLYADDVFVFTGDTVAETAVKLVMMTGRRTGTRKVLEVDDLLNNGVGRDLFGRLSVEGYRELLDLALNFTVVKEQNPVHEDYVVKDFHDPDPYGEHNSGKVTCKEPKIPLLALADAGLL